jgi:hypothetical protein
MNAFQELLTLDLADHAVAQINERFPGGVFATDFRLATGKQGSIDGWLSWKDQNIPVRILERGVGFARARDAYVELLRKYQTGLLVLPPLGHELRKKLTDAQINFLDTAGNCYVQLSELHLLIDQQEGTAPVVPTGKAFETGGLKLIHTTFLQPNLLEQPYRSISEQVGVSTGSLSTIFEDLRQRGFVAEVAKKRKLTNGRELVRHWAYGYVDGLRPKLHRGYFKSINGDLIERAQLLGANELLLGGPYGAMMRGDYLSSQTPTVYTRLRISELTRRYGLRPCDECKGSDTVEVLQPFWIVNNRSQEYLDRNILNHLIADSLLIYGDLLSSFDPRLLDAAEHLLEHDIRDQFGQFGLQW